MFTKKLEVSENSKNYGTTLVGIKYNGGVIIAADKQVSGNFILSTDIEKLTIIDEVVVGSTGVVGHCIEIVQRMKAIFRRAALEGQKMRVEDFIQILSRIILKIGPHAGFIVAGCDKKGLPRLYGVDAAGGFEDYTHYSSGSGSVFALRILDKGYTPKLSESKAKNIAMEAIKASIKRDFYSGGKSIDLAVVTPAGVKLEKIILKK